MQSIEVEAKTVEEAITLAGQQLHTTEDNLDIEVLEPDTRQISFHLLMEKSKNSCGC